MPVNFDGHLGCRRAPWGRAAAILPAFSYRNAAKRPQKRFLPSKKSGQGRAYWIVGAARIRAGERHRKLDLRPVGSRGQRFASHQFDRWPVLTEKVRCVVEIARLHANTACFSAGVARYLKVKIEADGFPVFLDRLIIQTHLVSPRFASFTLNSGFGFSLGAIMAR